MRLGWYALWGLHVDGDTITGLPTHVRYLRYLLDEVDEVRLFTNLAAARPTNGLSITDARLRIVPLPWASFAAMWKNLNAVRRVFATHLDGLDAMYARLFDPCPWVLDGLCRDRNIPLLMHMVGNPVEGITLREDWGPWQKRAKRWAFWPEEQLTLRAARRNRLIVNGSRLTEYYARRGVRGHTVTTSTLEEPDFGPIERPDGPLTVAFVGFLRPPKRVEVLLHAVADVRAQGHDLRARVIGGPATSPYRTTLDQVVRQRDLTSAVTFAGHVPLGEPLREEFLGAHVFGFPSASEGSPRVLLEAAASGLPLVSTDVGGVRDVFTDGKEILLAPIDDRERFAAQLLRIVEDEDLRRRLAVAGQNVARRHMGPDFMRDLLARLRPDRVTAEVGG